MSTPQDNDNHLAHITEEDREVEHRYRYLGNYVMGGCAALLMVAFAFALFIYLQG
jgi:hypothetical protein